MVKPRQSLRKFIDERDPLWALRASYFVALLAFMDQSPNEEPYSDIGAFVGSIKERHKVARLFESVIDDAANEQQQRAALSPVCKQPRELPKKARSIERPEVIEPHLQCRQHEQECVAIVGEQRGDATFVREEKAVNGVIEDYEVCERDRLVPRPNWDKH